MDNFQVKGQLLVVLYMMLLAMSLLDTAAGQSDSDDRHGGVVMGVPMSTCDDGKTNINIDWDPSSTAEFTCDGERRGKAVVPLNYLHCDEMEKEPIHQCLSRPINYTEDLPTSGTHRPLWPVYGEYKYVPPQRWLHSMEHGGVVFLYHPCANLEQIQEFKSVAQGCLWRHIISPYKKLPPDMNFALLTWKCKLIMSRVDVARMVEFIKAHALQAPEKVNTNGQYDAGLIQPAKIVSDEDDSQLCPGMSVLFAAVQDFNQRSKARRQKLQHSQDFLSLALAQFKN